MASSSQTPSNAADRWNLRKIVDKYHRSVPGEGFFEDDDAAGVDAQHSATPMSSPTSCETSLTAKSHI